MNPDPNITPEVKNVPEQIQQQTPAAVTSIAEVEETEKEINWRKFREQRELDRKAKEAAEKMASEERSKAEAMKAAMEALLNRQQPQQQQYDQGEETEEQRIAKQVDQIISQREAKARAERERQEQEEFPIKLQNEYPDFHQVVKSQNLDYLEYHYPEVAEPYKHMPDGFKKWQAIYKAVKRFVPNIDAQKDTKKAEANINKPQGHPTTVSPSGSGSGPATRIDEQRRAANWERMQKVMKGLS